MRAAIRAIVADADARLRPRRALAGERVGRLGLDPAGEGPLLRRGRRDLGARRAAPARARGDGDRPRRGDRADDRALARQRRTSPPREIELPSARESSLLCGEAGLLLVNWRLTPRGDLADRLLQRVRENRDNEFEELLWGSPGTMLIAQAMHGWTGEQRWADAWRESAEALMGRRDEDGIWTQQLYGKPGAPPWPGARPGRDRARAAAGRERVERIAPARDGGGPRPRGDRRGRACDVAGGRGRAARSCQRDPPAVVPRCARDGRHRGGLSRRGAAARRRRADVARGRAPRGEGPGPLPRHFRERIRALEDLRAHRRRAAGSGAPAASPSTRSRRQRRRPAGTRCSPAVSGSRSSQPPASTRTPAFRFSTGSRLPGWRGAGRSYWGTKTPAVGEARTAPGFFGRLRESLGKSRRALTEQLALAKLRPGRRGRLGAARGGADRGRHRRAGDGRARAAAGGAGRRGRPGRRRCRRRSPRCSASRGASSWRGARA